MTKVVDVGTESRFFKADLPYIDRNRLSELATVAAGFDLSHVVERYKKLSQLHHDDAVSHSKELVRYLLLSSIYPDYSFPMAGKADDFWHVFLVFTRTYSAFCLALSGRFLHHEPLVGEEESADQVNIQAYINFLRIYQLAFDEHPPWHIWPRPIVKKEFESISEYFSVL